jgi:hypothetical protein
MYQYDCFIMHTSNCVYFAISKLLEETRRTTGRAKFPKLKKISKKEVSLSYSCISLFFNIYFEPVICTNDLSVYHIVPILEYYNNIRTANQEKDYFHLGVRVLVRGISHFVSILYNGFNVIFIDNQVPNGIAYYNSIDEFAKDFHYKVNTVCIEMYKGKMVYYGK